MLADAGGVVYSFLPLEFIVVLGPEGCASHVFELVVRKTDEQDVPALAPVNFHNVFFLLHDLALDLPACVDFVDADLGVVDHDGDLVVLVGGLAVRTDGAQVDAGDLLLGKHFDVHVVV